MFRLGATSFQNLTTLTVKGFWQLISNFQETAQQVAGPVKIVEYGAAIADNGLANLLQFGALISINLAIINILPLPALDGGQLAFLLVEGLRGKPLPQRLQEGIMQTGLVLLLGLGFILIVRDTLNLAVFQ
jgi:RIP metalloprotease RseP